MVVGALREHKKEKTREALVCSALRHLARREFGGFTVEDIATACEISPRTFVRGSASAEEVLFADGDARGALVLGLDH